MTLSQAIALDLGILLTIVALSAWTDHWEIVTVYFLLQFARLLLRLDWREDILGAYRRLRPFHIGLAGLAAAGAMGAALALSWLAERWPLIGWSWLWLFDVPGQNLIASGLNGPPLVAAAYALAMLAVMPRIVLAEEWIFRRGTTGLRDAILRSIAFGLVHALVGVPVAVASLVLPWMGGLLSWEYLRTYRRRRQDLWPWDVEAPALVDDQASRDAVRASSLIHLAFNTWIVLTVLILLLFP